MVKLHLRAAEQWYDRAAAQGGKNDADKRDLIANKLTPDEFVEGRRLARNWTPKYRAKAGEPDRFKSSHTRHCARPPDQVRGEAIQ
jgi:hypothetical protein